MNRKTVKPVTGKSIQTFAIQLLQCLRTLATRSEIACVKLRGI